MIGTINESMTSKTVTDFSLGAQRAPNAQHAMGYARRVWKRSKPLYDALSWPLMAFIFTDSLVFVSIKDTGVLVILPYSIKTLEILIVVARL
ncbi:hypothetical protein ACLB1Q_34705 [Escherichia coli]